MVRGLKWLSQSEIPIGTILDVGAAYGAWSKKCFNFYSDADFILFEPNPGHQVALKDLALTSKQNITIVQKAAGSSGDTVPFYFDPDDLLSGAVTKEMTADTIEIELTTIDAALTELAANPPYLLKLDTHGIEKDILDGASETLNSTNALIIEAYNYRLNDDTLLFWELCGYLYERGFRPIDLVDVGHRKYDGSLWQMDLIFIRSTWEGFQNAAYK
jgi:FkbM family methyltransferase